MGLQGFPLRIYSEVSGPDVGRRYVYKESKICDSKESLMEEIRRLEGEHYSFDDRERNDTARFIQSL